MHSDECEAEVGEDALSSCCQHEFTTRKDVIHCKGKNKDGTQCKAEIHKKSKVCQKCGTNDDPQWLSSTVITCQGQRKDELISGNLQHEEEEFCIKCGAQWPTEFKDPAAKTETKIHPAKTCVKGEGSPMDTNSDNNYFREKSISKLGDQGYLLFHFHVLVSPDFKLNWEKHQVRMQMFTGDIESLHCRIFYMKHVRHVQGYEEMQICIKIEKHIVFGTGFNYQYARHNEKKGTLKWEKYKSGLLAADYRHCHLLDKWKDKSEYHQYDGIMNRGKGAWDNIKNTFTSDHIKKLEEDAGIAAKIFTQAKLLSTENVGAMLDPETLNMLDMLLLGLEKRYLHDTNCWSSQEGFRKKMATAMLSHILKSLESEKETPLFNYTETLQQAERRMQVALFVLTVIERFKFPLSAHNRSLLARSLLFRPHHETGTFHDLAIVVEKSLEEKRKLQGYIIKLCSSFQMNGKDPSWLCCIPLLHLLSGDVKPYQPPSDDIRHDAHKPHWWGIQSVKATTKKFKKCSKIWMIALDDIIRCLSPLFELDYFLPRTLMSVLQLSEVEMVIQTDRIPPEVCIATCSYYIKETRTHKHKSSVTKNEQIISCTKMLKEFLAKFEAPGRWSDSLLLQHASLTVRIAEDMVRITFERNFQREHNLLREVVQVFLEAMALYDTTQERLQNNESKDTQNEMLKNLHIRVKNWLIENYSNFLSDSIKMATAMLSHILKSLESEKETPLFNYTETLQQAERRMQVALFVLTVIERFKFPLSAHNRSLLARSLLFRPHHETGTFHDLAIVVEKSLEEKRKLQGYIIKLCSSFQMNGKDPSWLCCIPLLHLLSGDVKPYQPPSDDIRHDAHKPHWWGIQSVKATTKKFKKCSKIWMIALDDIIRCLSPLFELDYFLPRTLMSVLQLSEVEMVIQTDRIPPEVCIATCSYYIKETRTHKHKSSVTKNEQIISCTKMLKEFLAKFEAPGRWSDSLLLQHASLTVRIAEDMVRITFERNFQREHNLLREVVQVFLEAMALYDTTQERLQNNESKDTQNEMLKNLHIRVKNWLIENYSNFLSDSIKRWQDMLCSKTFRSPVVAGMWNAFIVDDFKKQWENENLHNMMQLVISSEVAKKENALQQLQDHQILVAGTGEQGMDIVDRFSTACMEFKTEVAEDVLNSIKITYGQKGIDSLISSLKQLAKVDTCDERVFVLCDSKHAEDVQKCVISHYSRAEKERTSPEEATKKYLIHGRNDNLKEWLEFREVEQAVQSMKNWYQEEFTLSSEEQPKADEVVAMVKNELPAVFIKQTKERIAVFSDNEGNIERAKYKVNMALGRIKITGRRRKHANPQTYDKSFSDTHMSKDDQMDAGLIFPSSSFQSMQQTVDLTAKSYCTKEGLTAKVYFGDLTSLPVDCIVNAANELLSHKGGVALAISKAAGRDFDQEGKEYVKKHGALPVTQCCVTSSGRLPYKVVIHAVGPRWSDYKYNEKERCTEDLKKTIVNCLIEANKFKMASIATPSLSSGIFGVPKALCAQMYAQAVVEYSMTYGLQSVKEIHFVDIIPDMCQLTQSAFDAEFQCS